MATNSIIEAAPLLTGPLRGRRQEVKRGVVEFALSSSELDDEFSHGDVSDIIGSNLFSMDDVSIAEALDYLAGQGNIEHIGGQEYRIIERPERKTFTELTEPVWVEFSERLVRRDDDIDVNFINENMKSAFQEFLYEFFQRVFESSEEVGEFEIDTLDSMRVDEIIERISSDHKLKKGKVFKESLKSYLLEPSDELESFTEHTYTGIINLNLLTREEETIEFELRSDNKKLYLDTNVLVAILCETDNFHPLITSTLKRAKQLDYDIFFLPETGKELKSFIDGSRYELREFQDSGGNRDVIQSQFVEDYLERDLSYGEYSKRIFGNWRDRLREHGIKEYDDEIEVPDDLYELSVETIERIERVKDKRGSQIKPPHKIKHDAKLISFVAQEKQEAENPSLGPFVISFDRTVATVGNLKETGVGKELSLHPRHLLEYILAFSPVSIDDGKRGDVALALLRSATNHDTSIDIDKYAKLIRPRTELEEGQEELLARILSESDRSRELEEALRRNRGDEADRIAVDILNDDSFLQQLSEEWNLKEQMRQAAQTAQEKEERAKELERKYENERELRESLQKLLQQGEGDTLIVQNSPDVTAAAHAEASATADAMAVSKQEFQRELEQFIEALDLKSQEGLENPDLPDPPEELDDTDRVESWLHDVSAALASEGAIIGAQALLPWAQELLDKVATIS